MKRKRIPLLDEASASKKPALDTPTENVKQWLSSSSITEDPNAVTTTTPPDTWCPVDDDLMASASQVAPSSVLKRSNSTSARESADFATRLTLARVRNADAIDPIPIPDNWSELRAILFRERETPPVSQKVENDVRVQLHKTVSETKSLAVVDQTIFKADWVKETKAAIEPNLPWMRHVPITSSTSYRFPNPQPDTTFAWTALALDPGYLEPLLEAPELPEPAKDKRCSYWLPNPQLAWPFATAEAKGPYNSYGRSHLQSQHNGAVMLQARLHLKRIAQRPIPYGQAFIFTIDAVEDVTINCHWAQQDDAGVVEYWTKELGAWSLHSVGEGQLTRGRNAVRNCLEQARIFNYADIKEDLAALRVLYPTEEAVTLAITQNRNSTKDLPRITVLSSHEGRADIDTHSSVENDATEGQGSILEALPGNAGTQSSSSIPPGPPTPTSIRPAFAQTSDENVLDNDVFVAQRVRKATPSMQSTSQNSSRSGKKVAKLPPSK